MNAVREAAKHIRVSAPAHMRSLNALICFITRTKGRGRSLKPNRKWDKRDKTFKFKINGKPTSDYATCTETRRSVTGYMVWFQSELISIRSVMQKIVALSSAEAELIALDIDVRLHYARVLKEAGVIKVKWISTELNEADVLTQITGHLIGTVVSSWMRRNQHESKGVY